MLLVSVIVPIVTALVPLFLTVTLLPALVVFTVWLPKLSGAPANEMAAPFPVRLTVVTG